MRGVGVKNTQNPVHVVCERPQTLMLPKHLHMIRPIMGQGDQYFWIYVLKTFGNTDRLDPLYLMPGMSIIIVYI